MAAVYYYPSTAIRVCVDDINGSQISGRAYCAQIEKTFHFGDIVELVLEMENIFDERGYPDAFQIKRSFIQKEHETIPFDQKLEKHKQMRQKCNIPQNMGETATFLVYVMSRRNSSWQGRVEWLNDGEITSFDSALQFLRLADSKLVRHEKLNDERKEP